jgi:hypothetical protein
MKPWVFWSGDSRAIPTSLYNDSSITAQHKINQITKSPPALKYEHSDTAWADSVARAEANPGARAWRRGGKTRLGELRALDSLGSEQQRPNLPRQPEEKMRRLEKRSGRNFNTAQNMRAKPPSAPGRGVCAAKKNSRTKQLGNTRGRIESVRVRHRNQSKSKKTNWKVNPSPYGATGPCNDSRSKHSSNRCTPRKSLYAWSQEDTGAKKKTFVQGL